jgi:multidrug efflux pump subunit AcrA (membrane-fusion protein)
MVAARVFYVAADRQLYRATQRAYYTVLVEADPASLKQAGGLSLQAGMPAEAFIEGESRTVLEYLAEPLTLVLRRAARER